MLGAPGMERNCFAISSDRENVQKEPPDEMPGGSFCILKSIVQFVMAGGILLQLKPNRIRVSGQMSKGKMPFHHIIYLINSTPT
jgi:hypothetical protein